MEKIWSGIKKERYNDVFSFKVEVYLVGGKKYPFKSIRFMREILIEDESQDIIHDKIYLSKENGELVFVSGWYLFQEDIDDDPYCSEIRVSFLSGDDSILIKLVSIYDTWQEMKKEGFKFQEFGVCDDSIIRSFDSSDTDYEYADELVRSDCYSLIEYKSVNGCIFAKFNGYEFEKFSSQFEFDYEADNCNTGSWGSFEPKCA